MNDPVAGWCFTVSSRGPPHLFLASPKRRCGSPSFFSSRRRRGALSSSIGLRSWSLERYARFPKQRAALRRLRLTVRGSPRMSQEARAWPELISTPGETAARVPQLPPTGAGHLDTCATESRRDALLFRDRLALFFQVYGHVHAHPRADATTTRRRSRDLATIIANGL